MISRSYNLGLSSWWRAGLAICFFVFGSLIFAKHNDANGQIPKPKRIAVVVGNSEYQNVPFLKNARRDAEAVGRTLENLGFKVFLIRNARAGEIKQQLEEVRRQAVGAEATLFYFSGHGFQMNNQNYLVPVDAGMQDRSQIEQETLRLDSVIRTLEAEGRQTLIFLDACRNNPLPLSVRQTTEEGLAEVQSGEGTFVAFATKPGELTADGVGDHSPFTNAFLQHVNTPSISINDLMINIRNTVEEATLKRQTPWEQSSLTAQFYFNPVEEKQVVLTPDIIEHLKSLDPDFRRSMMKSLGIKDVEGLFAEETDVASLEPPKETPVRRAPRMKIEAAPQLQAEVKITTDQAESPTVLENSRSVPAKPEKTPRLTLERAPLARETVKNVTQVESVKTVTGVEVTKDVLAESPLSTGFGTKEDKGEIARSKVANLETWENVQNRISDAFDSDVEGKEKQKIRLTDDLGRNLSVAQDSDATADIKVAALDPVVSGKAKTGIARLTSNSDTFETIVGQEVTRLSPAPKTEGEYQLALANAPDNNLPVRSRTPTETPKVDLRPEVSTKVPETIVQRPEDLALAVQTELKRLGCHRGSLDGDWGPLSRASLLRYYLGKKATPEGSEPDFETYVRLKSERSVVCKYVVPAPKKTKPKKKKRVAALPSKKKKVKRPAKVRKKAPAKKAKRVIRKTPKKAAPAKKAKRTLKRKKLRGVFR